MMADLPRIDQKWLDEHVGIVCDKCGHNRFIADPPIRATDVTQTHLMKDVIMRRRKCRNCGWVIWTEERKIT